MAYVTQDLLIKGREGRAFSSNNTTIWNKKQGSYEFEI